MGAQQKKIVLAVVGFLLAALVFWWQLKPDEQHQQYMANLAKSQQEIASGGGPAPASAAAAAPTASAAPARAAAASVPASSQFVRADVNIDELLQGVQKVDFNYEEDRVPRNPMRPLVGDSAPPRMRVDGESGGGVSAGDQAFAELMVRSMTLSGIVWAKKNPVAVVDNQVVTPGYEFPSGVVVESIEPDRVVMRVNESLVPIELEEL